MTNALLRVMPEAEYHAETKSGTKLSSHMLMEFIHCPLTYHQKLTGEIADEQTDAMLLGSAAHCLILQGDAAFNSAYMIAEGPVNPKTGTPYGRMTKAYKDWLAVQPHPVVTPNDYAVIAQTRQAIWRHKDAASILSQGLAERVVDFALEGEPCHARFDWIDPEREILADLKTCADLDGFTREAINRDYILQLAFYLRAARAAGIAIGHAYLIAAEKKAPYRVAVYEVEKGSLDRADTRIVEGVKDLRAAREAGEWKTGYEGVRPLAYPPHMA